jgi:hypothetical protein
METIRSAIAAGTFDAARRAFIDGYEPVDQTVREQQRQRFRSALRER